MEHTSDLFLARLQLYVDPKEQLLIHGECGYSLAVERSQATSHLNLRTEGGLKKSRTALTRR
jgi:hypothetical protein